MLMGFALVALPMPLLTLCFLLLVATIEPFGNVCRRQLGDATVLLLIPLLWLRQGCR